MEYRWLVSHRSNAYSANINVFLTRVSIPLRSWRRVFVCTISTHGYAPSNSLFSYVYTYFHRWSHAGVGSGYVTLHRSNVGTYNLHPAPPLHFSNDSSNIEWNSGFESLLSQIALESRSSIGSKFVSSSRSEHVSPNLRHRSHPFVMWMHFVFPLLQFRHDSWSERTKELHCRPDLLQAEQGRPPSHLCFTW